MGQYYKFVNTTKKSESTIPLPFNFNLPYAKSLESYSREELREKFDFVIQNNNWNQEDVVIAIGDYGAIFTIQKIDNYSSSSSQSSSSFQYCEGASPYFFRTFGF
jgi:hypothetical protein